MTHVNRPSPASPQSKPSPATAADVPLADPAADGPSPASPTADGRVDRSGAGIYLARHGQTAYNHERRFQGQLEIPLDETGGTQAVELAERAAGYGLKALWCSPLLRTRQTAAAVTARTGLTPREDARLMETDAGDWTGRLFSEIEAEAPELFRAFMEGEPGFGFPNGETFVGQGERVARALEEIQRGPLPALVVCHGIVIRLALSQRAGQRLSFVERVPNAAIIPLDPCEAEAQAQANGLGGGRATTPS